MILTPGIEAQERDICAFQLQVLGTGAGIICSQKASQAVTDTACDAFEPIYYSRKNCDEETKRQIRAHNAAWEALCKRRH